MMPTPEGNAAVWVAASAAARGDGDDEIGVRGVTIGADGRLKTGALPLLGTEGCDVPAGNEVSDVADDVGGDCGGSLISSGVVVTDDFGAGGAAVAGRPLINGAGAFCGGCKRIAGTGLTRSGRTRPPDER